MAPRFSGEDAANQPDFLRTSPGEVWEHFTSFTRSFQHFQRLSWPLFPLPTPSHTGMEAGMVHWMLMPSYANNVWHLQTFNWCKSGVWSAAPSDRSGSGAIALDATSIFSLGQLWFLGHRKRPQFVWLLKHTGFEFGSEVVATGQVEGSHII